MADVHNEVRLHLAWATWDHLPLLTPPVLEVVEQCIHDAGDPVRCPVLAIGGVEDRIHVLVKLSTTVTIAQLIMEYKGYSSRILHHRFPDLDFRWEMGYSVFPVDPLAVGSATEFVRNQKTHHRNKTLTEYLEETRYSLHSAEAA